MSPHVLILEPFCSGSHAEFAYLLYEEFKKLTNGNADMGRLVGKKWHWRARTGALTFSECIFPIDQGGVLLASSVLNLAELAGMRPDIAKMHKILYFHENELVYPVRNKKDRDFQYGYNQITSCIAADQIVFNSNYNKFSFLNNIKSFLKLMPDHRPKYLREDIEPKCKVIYYPLVLDNLKQYKNKSIKSDDEILHIVWPHRWEHDKNPELFFEILFALKEQGFAFKVSILGQKFSQIPPIFDEAKKKLKENISKWGYLNSKGDYYKVLSNCDIVVSTANHEFFGVAMLEAVYLGCYPLCPNRLVYPEIFPSTYLYNTPKQLEKRLRRFCRNPAIARNHLNQVNFDRFNWSTLKSEFRDLILPTDSSSEASFSDF